jgi:hypothetical protein
LHFSPILPVFYVGCRKVLLPSSGVLSTGPPVPGFLDAGSR